TMSDSGCRSAKTIGFIDFVPPGDRARSRVASYIRAVGRGYGRTRFSPTGAFRYWRRGYWEGGPAACEAPAGSRSDKKPRHTRSQRETSRLAGLVLKRNVESQIEPAWRGFLSLARPGRPSGTAGPPDAIHHPLPLVAADPPA